MITGNLQKKHGKYYAVLNLKDENGKRYQKWISTGITLKGKKREAEEFLAEQIKKFSDTKVHRDSIDVAAYFEEWLETADRDIRQNTYRGYRRNMENHIIPYFKEHKIKLDELTAMDLEDYYYSKLRPESNLVTGSALSPARRCLRRRSSTIIRISAGLFPMLRGRDLSRQTLQRRQDCLSRKNSSPNSATRNRLTSCLFCLKTIPSSFP